jgi:prepilin-type N-terminal cleavage/methylation domain-containing protein
MMNFIKQKRGHTLIELMVVLGIVSILVLASIPLFSSYMDQTRVDELKALMLKAAAAQEKHFAVTGTFAATSSLLTNYDFPDVPNNKIKLFTGARIIDGRGMTFWVNGSYDLGKASRECWIYHGDEGTMQRLTPSDPTPYTGVNCN